MSIGLLYALGAAIAWGLVYTIDQKILSDMSPAMFLFMSSIVSAVMISPYIFVRHQNTAKALLANRTDLLLVLLSCVLAILASFFIYSAIHILGGSEAAIIEIAYPFFAVLFGLLLSQTLPSIYFLMGGALIFAGSVIIVYHHH